MKNWFVSFDVSEGRYESHTVGGGVYGPYEQHEAEEISTKLKGWLDSLGLRKLPGRYVSHGVSVYQIDAPTFREIASQLNDGAICNLLGEPVAIPPD